MQRYFIPNESFAEFSVQVSGDDAHHIVKVMRSRVGDPFICSNGIDREALVEITDLQSGIVTAKVIEELQMNSEPVIDVWIAQCLPKGDKMEIVIQKNTEIGATRFIPFTAKRTIVEYDGKKAEKKLERWRKIAKEAAEQAHRNRIPVIEAPIRFQELLTFVGKVDLALLCYEKEQGLGMKAVIAGKLSNVQSILLIIGAEGGFTESEIASAEAMGCKSISLGSRILRTETAAMVGLTCILYEAGEIGGV